MGIMRRFLCWELHTASYIGFCFTAASVLIALLLRLLDLAAYADESFEISQGFHSLWRSHQWQAFVASDVVLILMHIFIFLFTVYMACQLNRRHFVMYLAMMRRYTYIFIFYVFVEFCFSVFEFSFYGKNTFRLAFVVFIWLFWLMKTVIYVTFICVLYARYEEMEDEMEKELRFHDQRKFLHSYA